MSQPVHILIRLTRAYAKSAEPQCGLPQLNIPVKHRYRFRRRRPDSKISNQFSLFFSLKSIYTTCKSTLSILHIHPLHIISNGSSAPSYHLSPRSGHITLPPRCSFIIVHLSGAQPFLPPKSANPFQQKLYNYLIPFQTLSFRRKYRSRTRRTRSKPNTEEQHLQ